MPYYSKNSNATSIDGIRIELVDLISNQLRQISTQKELLLWINETNCYVSCLFYDSEKEVSDESDNYSVVEFDKIIDLNYEETDETFYEIILNALNTISTESFKNANNTKVAIFETDEMNEPSKIFEIENGTLKILLPSKENWANNIIENEEILSTKFKRKKLVTWLIRTILAVVLYIIFWKYEWVKWSLFIYIPLNLFSLLSIFIWRSLLNKKLKKLKTKIE